MKRPVLFVFILALMPFSALAQNPTTRTLAEFVNALNWDPSKRGSLMVLEPEQVSGKKNLEGLAAFNRTRISLAGLSAIVPATMVIIDDSMLQAPNMYDGLPRHSKVLYLMTTLNQRQWEAITGSGLGISDLTLDQKAAFTSLLPKPFIYSTFTVGSDRQLDPIDKSVELSESDLGSVRLHLERSLRFMMPITGQQNAMTPRDTKHDSGRPGDKVAMRDWDQQFRPQDSFGMKIRQTVSNEQKPSDLNYRSPSFTGAIKLNPSERIADILSRIGRATSVEFHADFRVADRKMSSIGTSAPISSVLRVIALVVTGTYRRVGDAFILTSDLVGMGTRKLRLASYDSELNAKVNNEENLWRGQIFKSGHLSQIRYRSDDRLTPGDSLVKKLDQGSPGNEAKVSASDLTSDLRDFVQRQNDIYRTQQVSAEGATAQTEYEYSFILPSGDDTKSDIDTLGEHSFFASSNSEPRPQPQQPSMPKVDITAVKDPTTFCMTANTVTEAQHVIDLAAQFGFKDVWLDTLSPSALAAALKRAGSKFIRIGLAVRPFD